LSVEVTGEVTYVKVSRMPESSPWPFMERDRELETFERAWLGRGCKAVVVFGQAGVGKSRLAEEFLTRALGGGFKGVRVTASAAAAAVPMGAIAHLIPPGADLSEPVSGFAEIARLLTGPRGENRWAVLVDDLHLLDSASTTLLRHLLDAGAIRLIGTVRTGGPVTDPVEALTRGDAVCRIDLAPFDQSGAERLLHAALGAPVGHRTVHRLFEASGGNALYLRELVHGALEAGALSGDGEIWELGEGALPTTPRLSELIRARLAAARPAARSVLELLAVCGPVPLADAASAASMDVVAELDEAGLIDIRQDERREFVCLSHPLYGESLRTDLSVVRRRTLLLQQVERIDARGSRRRDDALHAAIYRLVATGTADRALLHRAAALARHAHDYEQAVALMRAVPAADRTYESFFLLGDSLVQLGRWQPADESLAEAQRRAGTPEQRVAAAMVRTWNLFWVAARTQEAFQVNEAARRQVTDRACLRLLDLNEAALMTLTGQPARGLEVLDGLEADIQETLDLNSWLVAAMSRTAGLAYVGRTREAIDWGRAAHAAHLKVDDRTRGPAHPASQLVPVVFALADAGELAEAAEVAERILNDMVDTDSARTRCWAAVFRGRTEWLAGDVAAARRWYADAIAECQIHRQVGPLRQAWGGLAAAAAVLGDFGTAEAALVQLRTFPAMGHQAGEDRLGEAWLDAARGYQSQARDVLTAAAAEARDTGQFTSEMLLLTDIARLGGAKQVTARLDELSGRCGGAFAPARARLGAALAADDPELLTEAAHELGAIGANLLAAEAAASAAAAWRRAGQARRATAAARLARTFSAKCPGARTPILAGAEATHTLTAREREIALLAAANLRSKEIAEALHLSVRTVDNHLQRAYAKLGVTTRHELAVILGHSGTGPA
jgi:DNA-binding CsgD family transcriptional regulator